MPQLKLILEQAKKLAIPTKEEQAKVTTLVKEILQKVSSEMRKQKVAAKVIVGGSVAKGTWLPGISDIDFFIIFNYERFSDRSTEISDFAEKVLMKIFPRLHRLRGSRDYFSTNYKGYNFEFVPVLDISKKQQARNITDFSPLHIQYVAKNAKIKDDVRLVKQFMKAASVYGAESYISGFSGHVADLLTAYCGTFERFVRNVASWQDKIIIDLSKKYKNKKEILQILNPSKKTGPLILIDPVEPERNAAAALGKEKFDLLKKACKSFLKKPSIEFFKEKHITIDSLIAKKGKRTLIILEAISPKDKPDIAGAIMKTIFEKLQQSFTENDFKILEMGWHFNKKTLFWFYFDSKPLSAKRLHLGPPVKLAKEHILGFKKAWKNHKVTIKNKRYVVELKRKYLKPKDLAKMLAKEFKLKLIHTG
jgi:tRNA nucleotidyltransferase (CCA-adding enzyme)